MNNLVTNQPLVLYRSMQAAITACDNVDECRDIINKSVALSAYYEQIRDTETVLRFNRVRLRSWRRIAELFAEVDISGCETIKDQIRKIRAAFTSAAVDGISDSRMYEILRLNKVSNEEFELALNEDGVTGSIPDLIGRTTGVRAANEAQRQRNRTAMEEARKEHEQDNRELLQREYETKQQQQEENKKWEDLKEASEAAFEEVGLTLDRRDRTRMKEVVFIIRNEVHTVMRQAAFDAKITMQEVLRRGLKMWLIAHDYEFPEETQKPRNKTGGSKSSHTEKRAS